MKLRRLCFNACLSVILFIGRSASVHAGIPNPPSEQAAPQDQAHPPGSRHPPGTRHPSGADTPLEQAPPRAGTLPGADTTPSRHPSPRPGTPREQTPFPGTRHPPPQQTATVADGTHPTGKHSCCINVCTSLLHDVIHVKFMPNRINV